MRRLIDRINPSVLLQVDGGIKAGNALDVLRAGADVLVSGSGVFSSPDPEAEIALLKGLKANNLMA
jgi:ribulose-phosphate 3-epimerase